MSAYKDFCDVNRHRKHTIKGISKGVVSYNYMDYIAEVPYKNFIAAHEYYKYYLTNPSALKKYIKNDIGFFERNETRKVEIIKVFNTKNGKQVEYRHFSIFTREHSVRRCQSDIEEFLFTFDILNHAYIVNPSILKPYLDKFKTYNDYKKFMQIQSQLIYHRWDKIKYNGIVVQ